MTTTTHGSIVTHYGTCQTCGLEDVDLKVNWDRKRDEPHYTCADEFACFAEWRRRRA